MSEPSHRVPPLDSWIVENSAAEWPGFRDLRSAASALGQRDRLRNTVSILVNDVRVAMAGAFLTAERLPSAGPLSAVEPRLTPTWSVRVTCIAARAFC